MIPAVSYLRMSTDAQEASIPAQRTAVGLYAAKHGYRIVREYVDSGISGDDTTKRLAFQRLRTDAAKGDFKAILCWDQDRFGRFDLMDAGFWIKPIRDAGVSLVTVGQGVIDWNDFAGRLIYAIQQEGKHQFLRDLSRNVNRGKLAKAQAGMWMGGAAPYGYRIASKGTLAIEPDEAETVRLIFRLISEGRSLAGARDELNSRGVVSPGGGLWRKNAIDRIVGNIVYCGHVRWNRTSRARYSSVLAGTIVSRNGDGQTVLNDPSTWTVVKNAHSAIVTEQQYAAAHAARLRPFPGTGRPSLHVVMFRGLLKCGHCGQAMHASWVAAAGDMVYVCSGYTESRACNPNRTYQKPLLQFVLEYVRRDLLNPRAIALARDRFTAELAAGQTKASPTAQRKTIAGLRAKLTKAESRLLEVPADMVAAVADRVRVLRSQVADAEHSLQAAEQLSVTPQQDLLDDFTRHVSAMQAAVAALECSEAGDVSRLLQATFSRVTVTSTKANTNQPSGRYDITAVDVVTKYAEILR